MLPEPLIKASARRLRPLILAFASSISLSLMKNFSEATSSHTLPPQRLPFSILVTVGMLHETRACSFEIGGAAGSLRIFEASSLVEEKLQEPFTMSLC